ncbi:MAG: hypothetical protein P4M11_09205 [Candidatus Pacebacteria bacterium]|nr:hypothetical protein [Candidatus Paceibacterota bacterium]
MERSQRDKVYYTEMSSGRQKDHPELQLSPRAVPADTPPPAMLTSTAASRIGKPADNRENFGFERSKLQHLQLEPAQQSIDVNDESICKLRKEILDRFQFVFTKFEQTASIIRVMSVILLFLDILEMICMFFLLLLMSLKMVPSALILLWISIALTMCLFQLFMLIKVISATQSKDHRHHRSYIWVSAGFFLACLAVIGLTSCTTIFGYEFFTQDLKRSAKSTLVVTQETLMITTVLKVAFQVVFDVLEVKQLRNLLRMSSEEPPQLDTQPTSSPQLVLVENAK